MSDLKNQYHCAKCGVTYSVSVMDSNLSLLKKQMNCPKTGCLGKLRIVSTTNMKIESWAIDALTLYKASMGAGLPTERQCSQKDLRKLMIGKKINKLVLLPSGDANRSIILSIELDDGKIVHLGSSTKGATAYKVTNVR